MFVIVCWFSSICVTSFSWKISNEIFLNAANLFGLLNQWDLLQLGRSTCQSVTVTVLLAGLSETKVLLLSSLIMMDLCFFCPPSNSTTFTVSQCVHWSLCSVKNYSSSRSSLKMFAVPLVIHTRSLWVLQVCLVLSCGSSALLFRWCLHNISD